MRPFRAWVTISTLRRRGWLMPTTVARRRVRCLDEIRPVRVTHHQPVPEWTM